MSDSDDDEIAAALEISRDQQQPVRTYYGGEVPDITSCFIFNLSTEHTYPNKYLFRMHSAELEWLNY